MVLCNHRPLQHRVPGPEPQCHIAVLASLSPPPPFPRPLRVCESSLKYYGATKQHRRVGETMADVILFSVSRIFMYTGIRSFHPFPRDQMLGRNE